MSEPPRILVIAGSARAPSYTRSLSRTVARALEARGARADVLDLQATPLPSMVPADRARRAGHGDPVVADLFQWAEGASAYVLASPTYHNSYSGVLKNALDYLTLGDMRYRPVGLMGHGGRSTQAVDHLRLVVRGLLGVAIPTQVCTADEDFAPTPGPDGDYEVRNGDILGRIDRFADELVLFARHLAALRAELDAARAG
ncbi:MAG: NADPH-dependent FMN reductase [Kiloniellaceae bacterium]